MAILATPRTGTQADLDTRVHSARVRISFGPVPQSAYTAAGLVVVIGALLGLTAPQSMVPLTWAWLLSAFALSMLHATHALAFILWGKRSGSHWFSTHIVLTCLCSCAWALSLWALPLQSNPSLEITMLAVLVGIATTGSSLLVAFRWFSRVWATPLMAAVFVYSALKGGPLGWFWVIFATGIQVLHWVNASRKERHLTEMLKLRFASEDMVAARNLALSEAQSLSETKSRFLATMSHEMRTPLHGILGLSRILQDESLSQQGTRHLTLLRSTGEHLLTIINDVLDFSRLQARHLQLHPEPTDVADVAARALDLAKVMARDKPLHLALDCQLPASSRWLVDPARLRQILLNLLGNAVKFTNQGHVRLTVQALPQHDPSDQTSNLLFLVEDTGVGIPQDQMAKIFDAFHQVNNNASMRSGTGLGLSIARQLCESMGGHLTCVSQVGQGSIFKFELQLPRATPDSSPPIASPGAEDHGPTPRPSWPKATVLVVDDNPVNLLVTEAQLRRLGLDVICVESGAAALEWLEQHTASIVLMDCHMPDMDGFEATAAIREKEAATGRTPAYVLALSASDEVSVIQAARKVGMQGALSKPFTNEAIQRVLNDVLV
jgi:signal transduction histidine kinase